MEYFVNLLDILEEEEKVDTFEDVYVLLRNQVVCNYAKKLVEQEPTQNDDFNHKLNIVSFIENLNWMNYDFYIFDNTYILL